MSYTGSYKRAGHIGPPPPVAYAKLIPPWGIGLRRHEKFKCKNNEKKHFLELFFA